MKGYILLAGIHGSGKTFLSNKIKKHLDVDVYSISNLIRQAGTNLDKTNKYTEEITNNQTLWKRELNKINTNKKYLLLDGHFCLLDSTGLITKLPNETFSETKMNKIILVKHNPFIIRSRLQDRDKKDYPLELLTEFQLSEIEAAKLYSKQFNVPLFTYDESDPFIELLQFIDS
ncbi:AAA family ATPase [Paenibacillus macerans]|uniref:AAA family ATPase n=1 Tax=Paenibacillus macerans TaxID=44252 RepID=A0A6N8F2E9_PAEMA|nr:ATP-binding protein [Paenibacillus macerans]MEC0329185.1 ATP-binding protein [Paenibacillus macerans]MUG25360.1 AAA family ATPase [Paenibacillus macerans]